MCYAGSNRFGDLWCDRNGQFFLVTPIEALTGPQHPIPYFLSLPLSLSPNNDIMIFALRIFSPPCPHTPFANIYFNFFLLALFFQELSISIIPSRFSRLLISKWRTLIRNTTPRVKPVDAPENSPSRSKCARPNTLIGQTYSELELIPREISKCN